MIGELIGNFRVVRRLGAGGMGEVWLAEHKDIRTKVAIKLLLPHVSAHKEHVQRFFNEAVAVSKIKHAGIAKIFDVGFRGDGEAYLVMEFLDGEPLSSRITRQGRLSLDRASDIARQIANVLEATHDAGIIHRDLKPDNVFLVADAELDGGERVKILDFGIAKLGGNGMTHTGGTMGTPAYMSPEQWKSSARVDGRADLYSLGCLVFELLCGRPPFVAESIGELCTLHLHESPPVPSTLTSGLPREIDELVLAMLAKTPDRRPSSREIKGAFTAFLGGASSGGSPPSASRSEMVPAKAAQTTLGASALSIATERPRRRRPVLIVGSFVVVAGSAAAFALAQRGGGGGGVAEIPEPPSVDAAIAPPPVARASHVTIEAVPASSEILLDGAPVPNPFRGVFPRSSTQHHIEVRAGDHVAESRWITFEDDRELAITLVPAPRPDPALPKPTRRPIASATRSAVEIARPVPVASKPEPAAGSATQAPAPLPVPTPSSGSSAKPTYKGTKGKIITEYPPQ